MKLLEYASRMLFKNSIEIAALRAEPDALKLVLVLDDDLKQRSGFRHLPKPVKEILLFGRFD